jgi:hypothetical protein
MAAFILPVNNSTSGFSIDRVKWMIQWRFALFTQILPRLQPAG